MPPDKKSVLATSLFFASAVFAQRPPDQRIDRVFRFNNTPSAPGFQEIATVLRTVAFIPAVTIDPASSSVSISGTSGDIALGEWMIRALDQPSVPDSAVHEYRVPGSKDDVVRMFYLNNIRTPQSMQELLTMLRTVASIRYVFQYTAPHALAIRGTTDQIALSAWMIDELDRPPNAAMDGIHQFHSSDVQFPVVRAFYLVHRTPKDIQETLTALRTTAHIQRAFAHTARAVVIIAGTPGQVDEASKLVATKDRAAAP